MLSRDGLEPQRPRPVVCKGCTNHCNLTVDASAAKPYISGNRCEKPLGLGKDEELPYHSSDQDPRGQRAVRGRRCPR